MRILCLELVLANAIMCGAQRFANLWLLPVPSLIGQRVGIRAESSGQVDDSWWLWFYRERLGYKIPHVRKGDLGTVLLERVAEPLELGHGAFGPAVWVFSTPKIELVSGKPMRAGYSDQPHVKERDRLAEASTAKEGK